MVIYEVNIAASLDIADSFRAWLREHIEDVLATGCFDSAKVFEAEELPEGAIKKMRFTVHYHTRSRELLEKYLTVHAPNLRDKGIKAFGNQFTASRRILTQTK